MTVSLNLAQVAATIANIEKINARAAKRGLAGSLSVEMSEAYTIEVCDHDGSLTCDAARLVSFGSHHVETRKDVEIKGEAPKFEGWTFAARIDRVGDSFTLATAPGVDYVSRDGLVLGQCSHCHTNRARNTTYVLINEAGERVQVGSTCIKDFLGWTGKIAWLDAPALNEEFFGGSYVAPQYKVTEVVRTAIASVRMRGFVSTQVFIQQSTRDHVMLAFSRVTTEQEKAAQRMIIAAAQEVKDEDVIDLMHFIASDDFAGTSTYVENLKVIVAQETVGTAQFGLLASAPQAYARHLGQVAERAAKKASEWVGNEGEKVTVSLKITKINNMGPFSYGGADSYLIIGQTEEGEIVKTFTTAAWSRDVEVGSVVTLQATVKAHEVRSGTKQTAITRAKKVA